MILQTMVILCCIFLQRQVSAEYWNDNLAKPSSIWDLFNWKITVQRQHQDKITVKGLAERNVAQDGFKIPGAICNEAQEWTGITGLPGFVMQCKCNLSSSTFVLKNMSCIANSKLKQGCQITTGSWRWSTSWSWDTIDDALIMLDMNGITTGLNVSAIEYQSCSVESLSYWTEDTKWMKMTDYFFNDSKPVMFTLNNMWHLSWSVASLQEELKKSLKGRILKFQVECEKPGPPQNEDEELEITSCLLVKASGEFNATSANWTMSQNTTAKVDTKPTSDKDTLLISLLIPLCFVLVILVVILVVICYNRRALCFTETSRQVTVLHDDVVQTKLLETAADESNV